MNYTADDIKAAGEWAGKCYDSLPPVDETSSHIKNNKLVQALLKYRDMAERYDLFELYSSNIKAPHATRNTNTQHGDRYTKTRNMDRHKEPQNTNRIQKAQHSGFRGSGSRSAAAAGPWHLGGGSPSVRRWQGNDRW